MQEIGVGSWAAFLRAHAAVVGRVERQVEHESGLPLSWYDVLLELDREPEGLRIQGLAARVVLSRSRISRLVEEIRRAELLDKLPDPDDGRASLVRITDLGRQRLRAAAPIYLQAIDTHWTTHLSPTTMRAVRDGLTPLLEDQPGDAG